MRKALTYVLMARRQDGTLAGALVTTAGPRSVDRVAASVFRLLPDVDHVAIHDWLGDRCSMGVCRLVFRSDVSV